MPFKYIAEHWHLPKEYNRRVKLLPKDKEKIKQLYADGTSINGIARAFSVSKRLIQFVLFPDRAEKSKQLRKIRGGSKIYYDRERNRMAQLDTRKYKQKIYKQIGGKYENNT